MAEEQWKSCVGYEGIYEVSSLGRVKRSGSEKCLERKGPNKTGHPFVWFYVGKHQNSMLVCRLVAMAFLGATMKSYIHHANGELSDCCIGNLSVHRSKRDLPETMRELTYEIAKKRFSYNPETGEFMKIPWRGETQTEPYKTGSIDRKTNGKEYFVIQHAGIQYYAHRVAILLMNGDWPVEVDHINGNGLDNRIENLKVCSRSENSRNRRFQRDEDLIGIGKTACGKWFGFAAGVRSKHFDDISDARKERDRIRKEMGFNTDHGKRKESANG